jgi:hypothetical protein
MPCEQGIDRRCIANVDLVVRELPVLRFQPFSVPGGACLAAEEIRAHVIVEPDDVEALVAKEGHGF